MSIEYAQLSELNADDVAANLAETSQRVVEATPTLDLRRGVIHDIVVYLHAVLATGEQQNLKRYQSAQSLLDIQADPTLADVDVVDKVLSNYRLTRGEGASATGSVTIVLSGSFTVTIGSGAIFTANGQQYTADTAYTAKSEPDLINNASDRLLTKLDDGNWAFTIDVTAVLSGTAALVKKDTLIAPSALPQGYVTSYATADFTGGLDPESNNELLDRLQQGIAAKAPSNRINMQAMLRAEAAFARVLRTSVIGHGDEEMIRDQHTIWPGSLGGRVDWWVRSQERVLQLTLTKTATLLAISEAGVGTWQVELNRDDAPGFYEVSSIRLPSSEAIGTFTINADVRGLDLSGDGFVPDIVTVPEGAYSRFQTAVLSFDDTVTDHSVLTTGSNKDYQVTVRVLPLIAEIQTFISSFDIRSYGADVLIKAPIPCFTQLSFTIAKNHSQADPDVAAIKEAVARRVNNIDFVGRLFAGDVQDVIYGFLPEGMSVGAIDLFGRLRFPDGTTRYVRSSEVLKIIAADGVMVSPRTVAFFTDPESISVTVKTEVPTPQ